MRELVYESVNASWRSGFYLENVLVERYWYRGLMINSSISWESFLSRCTISPSISSVPVTVSHFNSMPQGVHLFRAYGRNEIHLVKIRAEGLFRPSPFVVIFCEGPTRPPPAEIRRDRHIFPNVWRYFVSVNTDNLKGYESFYQSSDGQT